MKRAHTAATVLLAAGLLAGSFVSPVRLADDAAVRGAVQAYFEGMMTASPETLRRAFHPEARLIGTRDDGSLLVIPFEQWAGSWEGKRPLGPDGYENRIVQVDIHGDAASVKTELTWPDVRYVDYLALLRVEGEWKIVNKIWNAERP